MDAVITAGGIPRPDEGLYAFTNGTPKALLEIAGKPMAQWVLDALDAAQSIDNLVLVGLDPDSGITAKKPTYYLPNQGSMVNNIKAGVDKLVEINPQAERFLLATSDIPAVTPEMVDWVVDDALQSDHDLVYNVSTRPIIEARFPGSNRTYLKLRGVAVCGGDMSVLKTSLVTKHEDLWKRFTAARKTPLKLAALVGLDTLFLVLFRLVDLEGAARKASQRLGINARAVVSPYPEIAMDVDKPYQLELLTNRLEQNFS